MTQKFSIISAIDNNRGIGINNSLPWHLKADLKHFSETTIGKGNNAVIMGLNTWKSLPEKYRPFSQRLNVVLSLEPENSLPEGILNFQSLDEALHALAEKNLDTIFIGGGAYLYKTAITHSACERLYLTEIQSVFECDTFFPAIPADFKKIETGPEQEENGIKFRFCVYQKEA